MRSHHIIALPGNTLGGKDYIIGDVHGDTSFSKVLSQLTPNDRLFIVGDLTDRGEASATIVPQILAYQEKYPNRIYVVRGNHEDFCLSTIAFLEAYINEFDAIRYRPDYTAEFDEWLLDFINQPRQHHLAQNFVNHMKSGGEWLVRLYKQELYDGDITVVPPDEASSEACASESDEEFEVIYEPSSKIGQLKAYMESLPYIIYVDGERPFTIAHADNPLSQTSLDYRITHDLGLIAEEIYYLVNARATKSEGSTRLIIEPLFRTVDSILSYNGHNILIFGKAAVVRYQGNASNLDVASYLTHVALRVNHTDGACEYIGENVEQSLQEYPILRDIQTELSLFLQSTLQKQITQTKNKNLLSPMKSGLVARMQKEQAEKREPLSPSKRAALNAKRERDAEESSKPASPKKNSPTINGMNLFAAPGERQRKLFDEGDEELKNESPLKRKA